MGNVGNRLLQLMRQVNQLIWDRNECDVVYRQQNVHFCFVVLAQMPATECIRSVQEGGTQDMLYH